MSAQKKYEFDSVDWGEVKSDVAEAVLGQYRNRLDTSLANFDSLDGKGRYGLTGLIGLTTAVLAYTNDKEVGLSLSILLVGLVVSSLCFGASLWTRRTSGTGVTPSDMRLGKWAKGMSNPNAKNEMTGIVICQYAANIEVNEASNSKKSNCIRAGLVCVLLTLLISVVAPYAIGVIRA